MGMALGLCRELESQVVALKTCEYPRQVEQWNSRLRLSYNHGLLENVLGSTFLVVLHVCTIPLGSTLRLKLPLGTTRLYPRMTHKMV